MAVQLAAIRALAAEVSPSMVELRRDIHANPELGHREFETTKRVADALSAAGVASRSRMTATGLVAEIGRDGPTVGFRADLDALPIDEAALVPFRSTTPGVMHACGHDAHTAIGVGIAAVLKQLELPGRVRFIFQPAEEIFPGGALDMVKEGAAENLSSILAFHVDPSIETGTVGLRTGAITGSSDGFSIELSGPGGHTARPHETVDLVLAAGKVITELTTLLDRVIDARKPVAVVFGQVIGGNAANVIPTRVQLNGTARTLDREVWEMLPALLDRLTEQIVAPYGASAAVHYSRGIPPVINDAGVIEQLQISMREALGSANVLSSYASLGGEDFSRYLETVPGALVRLGVGFGDRSLDLHSASFDLDERAIEVGIAAGAHALIRLLEDANG
jgi:amidohydrolase